MKKYIEIDLQNQVDRYFIDGISVDQFIDYMVNKKGGGHHKIKDITEKEFNSHKNKKHSFYFNVEGKFDVCHYPVKHESKEMEKEWNKAISKHKKSFSKFI